MTALTNHTTSSAFGDGYGRCPALRVWTLSFPQHSRLGSSFLLLRIMEEKNLQRPHTPGPWQACRLESMFDGAPYVAGEDGHGIILASVSHGGRGNYEGQVGDPMADALLMAAAPELLRCTRYLRIVCDDRLSMLQEEFDAMAGAFGGNEEDTGDIEERLEHYRLLKKDAEEALAKAGFQ